MLRTQRPWLTWVAGGALFLIATHARAIYLDPDQNVTLRARIYSQAAIRIEDSSVDTVPRTFSGQLIQHRNFFNPELDAKLTPYMNWMKTADDVAVVGRMLHTLAPDDLRFRLAGWGFYDGLYDYGAVQFKANGRGPNGGHIGGADILNNSFNPAVPGNGFQSRTGGWFIQGPGFDISKVPRRFGVPNNGLRFGDVFPNFQLDDPRSIYGNTARANELYLSYTKGPLFLRVGRQSISWGESDTIALLDQSNPFDLTLGAPGFFEDIDEARIPLYTVRASYNLFDVLGPFSSGFIENYWVPGNIDATTATTPILTVSPYSPRGVDPQFQGGTPPIFPPSYQFVFFDHTLPEKFSSSRWGFRFQTVINRFLTAQAWVYRTFPSAPVPVKLGLPGNTPPPITINNTPFYIIALEHKPVMVYGLAGTFFVEWLDGIARLNAQLFEHEAGFIPRKNLLVPDINPNKGCSAPNGQTDCNFNRFTAAGSVPYADILRYEVGFDRFFFMRFLNPSNSFIVSASAVGTYNSSWTNTATTHFRFNGQLKPTAFVPECTTGPNGTQQCTNVQRGTARGTFVDDYVDQKYLDAQFQTTFQTDYMHGRLTPRLTLIQFWRGTFAMHPTLTYRWNDWLLFQGDYQHITGDYQSIGFFRDRDQVSFRVTYQLN